MFTGISGKPLYSLGNCVKIHVMLKQVLRSLSLSYQKKSWWRPRVFPSCWHLRGQPLIIWRSVVLPSCWHSILYKWISFYVVFIVSCQHESRTRPAQPSVLLVWHCLIICGDNRVQFYSWCHTKAISISYSFLPKFIAHTSFLWTLQICLRYKCVPYLTQSVLSLFFRYDRNKDHKACFSVTHLICG